MLRTKHAKSKTTGTTKIKKNKYLQEGSGYIDGNRRHYIVKNGKLKRIKVPPEPDW